MRTLRPICAGLFLIAVLVAATRQGVAQSLDLRSTVNLTPRTAVAASGNYTYSVGNNSFVVIDHSDPAHPEIRGQTAPGVPGLASVDVANGIAYCAGGSQGLVIINADVEHPQWIANLALASTARDADVSGELCAVATAANVSLVRVTDPAHPEVVDTYGRAATWLEFSNDSRIFVGSQTGAYVLHVTRQIAGGDTTWSLSLDDEYGSSPISTLDQNGSFVNLARGADLLALHAGTFELAGSYSASGVIRAVESVGPICFIALALGGVQYLDQRGNTPEFVTSEGLLAPATGLAGGSSSQGPVLAASHSNGVSFLTYSPLAAENPRAPFVPERFSILPYPNPFNGLVNLQLAVDVPGLYELVITNPVGQIMLSENLFVNGTITKRLNLALYGGGIYFATLRSDRGISHAAKLLFLP